MIIVTINNIIIFIYKKTFLKLINYILVTIHRAFKPLRPLGNQTDPRILELREASLHPVQPPQDPVVVYSQPNAPTISDEASLVSAHIPSNSTSASPNSLVSPLTTGDISDDVIRNLVNELVDRAIAMSEPVSDAPRSSFYPHKYVHIPSNVFTPPTPSTTTTSVETNDHDFMLSVKQQLELISPIMHLSSVRFYVIIDSST